MSNAIIKAVIWDMDGVLIDSEPFWRQAEVEILSAVGVPITIPETFATMGQRIDAAIKFWFDRFPWSGPSQAEIALRVVKRVIELVHNEGEIKPGVLAAMELIQSRKLRMCLASSSSSILINAVVAKLGLQNKFEFTHSAELEVNGKPHPAVYLSAARKLALAPEVCLAIEDSGAGVESAKNAGMKCLCVPDPHVDRSKVQRADWILASLTDLKDFWPDIQNYYL